MSASSSTRVLSASSVEALPLQVVASRGRACPPRCGRRAPGQHLSAQRHATAQGHDLDVFFGPRQAADLGRHLVGQLARGAQHQGLHGEAAGVEVGQQGQGKRGGLAAAGAGLGDQVFAQQRGGRLAAWMGVIVV